MKSIVAILALAACGYPRPQLSGGNDDAAHGDGTLDGPVDAAPDAIPPDAKAFVSFGFTAAANTGLVGGPYEGVISEANGTIVVHMFGTAPTAETALVPTWDTTGVAVTVGGTPVTSGTSPINFTLPVTFEITARDGSKRSYLVALTNRDLGAHVDVGGQTSEVAVGDLDRNGILDLFAAANADSILLGTTAMNATTPTFTTTAFGATAVPSQSAAIADFDHDTVPDLAYADATKISVSRTTSAAGQPLAFDTPVTIATGTTHSLQAADFDGDGKIDLAAFNNSIVQIALNTTVASTAITFATPTPEPMCNTAGGFNFVAADVNGDSKPDLLVACLGGTGSVGVRINTSTPGTLSFAAEVAFPVGQAPTVAVGDIDGDGKLDIVSENTPNGTISVLLNTTATNSMTPAFTPKVDIQSASVASNQSPFSAVFADLDGDGKQDVVVANSIGTISILLNRTHVGGTPTFAKPIDRPSAASCQWSAVGDFNHDGKLDIATVGGFVGIHLAQ